MDLSREKLNLATAIHVLAMIQTRTLIYVVLRKACRSCRLDPNIRILRSLRNDFHIQTGLHILSQFIYARSCKAGDFQMLAFQPSKEFIDKVRTHIQSKMVFVA